MTIDNAILDTNFMRTWKISNHAVNRMKRDRMSYRERKRTFLLPVSRYNTLFRSVRLTAVRFEISQV